jgi:hypothetical protein
MTIEDWIKSHYQNGGVKETMMIDTWKDLSQKQEFVKEIALAYANS